MEQVTQPFELDRAVRLILERVKEGASQIHAAPLSLGISGIDCSGKSTLAKELFSEAKAMGIGGELAQVDDFIIPRAERKRGGPAHIDYFENTFDHAGFKRKVDSLKTRSNASLVIGEGVFVFKKELAPLWDIKVWIDMPDSMSVERGAVRDADYFGSAENARGEYLRRFIPAHKYHLERDQPVETADIVFEVR